VIFNPFDSFSYKTMEIGSDVYIGPGAVFQASESAIHIASKVLFGPRVTIMGGDHNSRHIGEYMYDVKTKSPEDDLPVRIETDVWVGTGAIILKGVTIGRGAIVAAGALCTKDVPPYSISGGIPAKVLGYRFTPEEIVKHEQILEVKKCVV
jgi:acetyltransferase-like isoleucine patch superfamily enzyme